METKTKKILIIEDERAIAKALEFKLTRAGFEAKAVFNGGEGLAILEKEPYDLILCDLIMPRIDGFMVLEALKQKKIETPVIILSNLSQDEDKLRAKALGAKDFFIKSNTPIAMILEKVNEILK